MSAQLNRKLLVVLGLSEASAQIVVDELDRLNSAVETWARASADAARQIEHLRRENAHATGGNTSVPGTAVIIRPSDKKGRAHLVPQNAALSGVPSADDSNQF